MSVSDKPQSFGRALIEKETANGAREFLHVARHLAANQGNPELAYNAAKHSRALPRILEALEKTAATAGTTTGWGQQLTAYSQLQDAFLLSLRGTSSFLTMLPFMKTVPVGLQNIAVATSSATATTVGEGQSKPVTKMEMTQIQVTEKKTTAIVAVTKELLAYGSSNVFGTELSNAVAEAVDASFILEITSGISPTTSAGGGSVAILTDIAAALASLTLGANSKVFLLVSSDIAKLWSVKTTAQGELLFPNMTPTGGEVQGMPVIVTNAVTAQIIAVDAAQLAGASGNVVLDSSESATLQFDNAPDSPPSASTAYISLFQMNFAGIRATVYWAVGRLRTGAVSVIGSVAYTANSPA